MGPPRYLKDSLYPWQISTNQPCPLKSDFPYWYGAKEYRWFIYSYLRHGWTADVCCTVWIYEDLKAKHLARKELRELKRKLELSDSEEYFDSSESDDPDIPTRVRRHKQFIRNLQKEKELNESP